MTPNFIQIHYLTSYSGALLNRDDTGMAKRLPYGGAMRTRVSSQCQKRHWRTSEGPHALQAVEGAEESYRSRDLVTKLVRAPFEGEVPEEILNAAEPFFQAAVYGAKKEDQKGGGAKKGAKKGKAAAATEGAGETEPAEIVPPDVPKTARQPLLMGHPEIRYLREEFGKIVTSATSPAEAQAAAAAFCEDKAFKASMQVMRERAALHMGLPAALFGRMVTSDKSANIDAPIHVGHAFTVHAEESESDYFAVMDDLAGPAETASDHLGETELTSGVFYGYVVVDVAGLVSNLTGRDRKEWLEADRGMAAKVVSHLLHLIAETSVGAKKGSTAPYAYAHTLLVEVGDRQPRSLSGAFRAPGRPTMEAAEEALSAHLGTLDQVYETGEARRFLSLRNAAAFPGAERASMRGITEWVSGVVRDGAA